MAQDKLTIEILPDGTLKTTTDGISAANHDNAENFLRNVARLAGGVAKRVMRSDIAPNLLKRLLAEHTRDGHTHNNQQTHNH